jgi:hypothetical protein
MLQSNYPKGNTMKTITAFYATPQTRQARIQISGLPAHLCADARFSQLARTEDAALRFAASTAQSADVDMQVWRVTAPAGAFVRSGRALTGLSVPVAAGQIELVADVTSIDADDTLNALAA